jgi:hypothetical protein
VRLSKGELMTLDFERLFREILKTKLKGYRYDKSAITFDGW